MEEQLHREQETFENLKELVRETRQRLESELSTPDNRSRQEKVTRLGSALNLVAARHLDLISTRFNLENLVSQMLQESIYQSMMVRFHIRREFLGIVIKTIRRVGSWSGLRCDRCSDRSPLAFWDRKLSSRPSVY